MNGNDRSGKFVQLISAAAAEEALHKKVEQRRWGVAFVTFGIFALGLWMMIDIVGARGWTSLEVADVVVFGILFASLSFGFTQAFLGFLVLEEGNEPLKITNTLDESTPLASTAIVMPVFNEDAETVFGNIRALYASIQQRHELDSFDFYILSDSTDPEKVVEEELAWADICRQTNGFGKIHYRRRRLPESKERKYRRFLPALGSSSSLYDCPGCGQSYDGSGGRLSGSLDGVKSACRNYSDDASPGEGGDVVRADSTVRITSLQLNFCGRA